MPSARYILLCYIQCFFWWYCVCVCWFVFNVLYFRITKIYHRFESVVQSSIIMVNPNSTYWLNQTIIYWYSCIEQKCVCDGFFFVFFDYLEDAQGIYDGCGCFPSNSLYYTTIFKTKNGDKYIFFSLNTKGKISPRYLSCFYVDFSYTKRKSEENCH